MSTLIKQIPDEYAEFTGLHKYNRSRMPGTFDIFQANIRPDGSFLTGLNEQEEREISDQINKDVSKRSDFWETFQVVIRADQEKQFNIQYNPLDKLSYKMLVANGYVAPTKDDVADPKYLNASYYAYTEETKDKEETNDRINKDIAISKLLDISKNKERMVLYGQYLEGLNYHDKLGEATLYKMLRAYIENKKGENAHKFIEVYEKPIEEVVQKIIIDKAIKHKLITKSLVGKKQVYQYGQVTLGNSLKDVYTNLSSVEFSPELLSIKQELEK